MPKHLNGVLQQVRKLAAVQSCRALSDRELLARFVQASDESAFTMLVERHGPLVLGVCRRALGHHHDAEDACQATFLVLARKAASIKKTASLSSWLHSVACRMAVSLKRDQARRRRREIRGAGILACRQTGMTAPQELTWSQAQALLDQELDLLPPKYRTPLILCYLDGKTRDEAAQQLGVSVGSLHGLLERGRTLLRDRLTRRGVTLPAALLSASLGGIGSAAALSPTLVVASARTAVAVATGQPLAAGVVSSQVLSLSREVLKTMFLAKLKIGVAMVVCTSLFVAALGGSFLPAGLAQTTSSGGKYVVSVTTEKTESDEEFVRRLSKDLRGHDPSPAEVHFFRANKDAGKRQKLVDLFIQERQAKKDAEKKYKVTTSKQGFFGTLQDSEFSSNTLPYSNTTAALQGLYASGTLQYFGTNTLQAQSSPYAIHGYASFVQRTGELARIQNNFYSSLLAPAKEKKQLATIVRNYQDALLQFIKDYPKNSDLPDAMLLIEMVYRSQGKTVEADAWGQKLEKEYPSSNAANYLRAVRSRSDQVQTFPFYQSFFGDQGTVPAPKDKEKKK
ncbi:MAG: sigma-70 family RNA polymerase sigma factor [Gemmataceae bacterium]|nr:sigma-70 family RNA polymerase sigma factor [Gemmataceae bacterium]MCI0741845.1 sigma-70 family RNA polymerase sigma factor [Gemmataceae bacterium]